MGRRKRALRRPHTGGFRDYGTATWDGGDSTCDHRKVSSDQAERSLRTSTLGPNRDGVSGQSTNAHQQEGYRSECGKCGAVRIDSQLGLETTPDEYVASMVAVFADVRRVLKDDGTLWLNLGDSYCATDKWGGGKSGNTGKHTRDGDSVPSWAVRSRKPAIDGIKPKDLVGIPWMVAFALRADGWYLRSDIIWSKPNPMPESVTDRPTKAHEYIFLLSKSARYFYDADAIKRRG
jgi:hypothetical protein